jgi:type IV fimbrial biogenesis protein FimT
VLTAKLRAKLSAKAQQRGVTLIELMVAITLLSVLLGLAAPSFRVWVRNAQVRTVTDALQTGLRLAQTEAVRRNRQVVFFLTNSRTCDTSTSAVADGTFWSIRTVPLLAGDPAEVVQCGVLADVASEVAITGAAAVCFNSLGRQVANASTGVTDGDCIVAPAGINVYNVSAAGGDRPLRVQLSLGGQTRMCDPARTLSATVPDGC